MKTDLRNLVTAQEGFYFDNNDYAGGTTSRSRRQRDRRRRQGSVPAHQRVTSSTSPTSEHRVQGDDYQPA